MAADPISAHPAVETGDSREAAPALDPAPAGDPIFDRLEKEIEWYSRKSARCQRLYKWLKFVEIVAAAAIPLLAGFDTPDRGPRGPRSPHRRPRGLAARQPVPEQLDHLPLDVRGVEAREVPLSRARGPIRGRAPAQLARRADRVVDLPGAREMGFGAERAGEGPRAGRVGTARGENLRQLPPRRRC